MIRALWWRHGKLWKASLAVTCIALAAAGTALAASARSGTQHATAAGGAFVVGLADEPDTLDPEVTGSRSAYSIDRQIFDTLVVRSDKTKKFSKELATSWSSSKNGEVFTFQLRRGVKFQDGTPFDAKAVVFNLDRGMNPKTKSQTASGILGPYKSSKAIGAYTVKVFFKSPTSPVSVLDALSQSYWGMVSPAAVAKYGADFGRHPVGTGPFTFKEWVPNDHITLVRNAAYTWGSPLLGRSGPARLQQVTFRIIPDSATRVAALQSGSIDLDLQLEPGTVKSLAGNSGIKIVRGVAPGFPVCIWMNTAAGPLKDLKVRQAVLWAFDRNTLLKSVYSGQYAPAYGPLSPVTWSYTPAVQKLYSYNLAKAGKLLDQAGWKMGSNGYRTKNGTELTIRFFDLQDARRGEYLQANLKKVGIKLVVRIVTDSQLFAVIRKASTYDMASTWFASSDPSILNILFQSSNVGTGFAISRLKSKWLDDELMKGVTTGNIAKRASIYKQIQLFVMKNALLIPMYSETELDGLRSSYSGYQLERGQYPILYGVH
jgi:peptide/nickel transport system substrate-binding protein